MEFSTDILGCIFDLLKVLMQQPELCTYIYSVLADLFNR